MPPAHVQSTGTFNDSGATSTALAYGSNVVGGNLLFVGVSFGGDADPTGISDTRSSSWTQVQTTCRDATSTQSVAAWWAVAGGSGANTVTVTHSNFGFRRIVVAEYSGLDTATPLVTSIRVLNGNFGTGTDAATSGNMTPQAANQLVVGICCATTGDPTYTQGTNYTERVETASTSGSDISIEDRLTPNANALAATWTLSIATTRTQILAAIFEEPGPPQRIFRPNRYPCSY